MSDASGRCKLASVSNRRDWRPNNRPVIGWERDSRSSDVSASGKNEACVKFEGDLRPAECRDILK